MHSKRKKKLNIRSEKKRGTPSQQEVIPWRTEKGSPKYDLTSNVMHHGCLVTSLTRLDSESGLNNGTY